MIEMGKKYQTRDGRAVRILAIDFKAGATCIIGAIAMGDNNEIVGLWDARGVVFGSCDHLEDLVPVPTEHEAWAVIPDILEYGFNVFLTRDAAEQFCSEDVRPLRIRRVIWED